MVTCDSREGPARGSYFNSLVRCFSFSCRSLEGPNENRACGFCVLTVCTGDQPRSTKKHHCCTSLRTKRKLNRGEEALACFIFYSLPELDLRFLLQIFFSKLSIPLSSAASSFVWPLGTFPCQMLSHLDVEFLLSWQTDL